MSYLSIEPSFIELIYLEVHISYKEALSGSDSKFWNPVTFVEINFQENYDTWDLFTKSKARNVLSSKSIFEVKNILDTIGSPTENAKWKLVARGFKHV